MTDAGSAEVPNLFRHVWGRGRPEDDPDGDGRYARCTHCDARENTPEAATLCPAAAAPGGTG